MPRKLNPCAEIPRPALGPATHRKHVPTYEADYGVRFVCSCGEVSRYWSTRKAAEEMHGYHAHPETAPAPRPGTTVLEVAR